MTAKEQTLSDAISEIDSADSSCNCSIIRKCDDCSTRLRRRRIIEELEKLMAS